MLAWLVSIVGGAVSGAAAANLELGVGWINLIFGGFMGGFVGGAVGVIVAPVLMQTLLVPSLFMVTVPAAIVAAAAGWSGQDSMLLSVWVFIAMAVVCRLILPLVPPPQQPEELGLCPSCRYPIADLERCPECGLLVTEDARDVLEPRWPALARWLLAMVVVSVGVLLPAGFTITRAVIDGRAAESW